MFRSLGDKNRVPSPIPLIWAAVWVLTVASVLSGQTTATNARNNPFSPSPPGKSKRTAAAAYVLSDPKTDNVLIYPGDIVEFVADKGDLRGGTGIFYFVSGEVVSAGQREYVDGLTLYQAVTAAGGPKGDPKKAILRKNNAGMLVSFEHNLRAIKSGKAQDPALLAGDVVEIKN